MKAELKLNSETYNIVLPLSTDHSTSTVKIIAKNSKGISIEIPTEIESVETVTIKNTVATVTTNSDGDANIVISGDSVTVDSDDIEADDDATVTSDGSLIVDNSTVVTTDSSSSSEDATLDVTDSSSITVDEDDIEEDD